MLMTCINIDNNDFMKILFIYPSMSEKENYRVRKTKNKIKSWCLEPLAIATLNGLTPKEWERNFFDDRLEDLNYNEDCDIVAISSETFTIKRAYEICREFKKKGKKVILGGFHSSILPQESLKFCDSVLIGEAEGLWEKVLNDVKKNKLKRIYRSKLLPDLSRINVDRSIYGNKKYFPFTLIETSRGCCFDCDFCSVSLFFRNKFRRRPIENIIEEIKRTKSKKMIFVDDNICADIQSAKELFRALIPLKIKWGGQASLNITKDKELLDLIKKSGCIGLLIGFESLKIENIKQMGKNQNLNINYDESIKELNKRGIKIYASFILGYDYDDPESIKKTLDYAIKKKFFIINFTQLTPFPGTRLYNRLKKENRLIYNKWWLDPNYTYGKIVYIPKKMSPGLLYNLCSKYKIKFYSYNSIIKRLTPLLFKEPVSFFYIFVVNMLTRIEVFKREKRFLGRKK